MEVYDLIYIVTSPGAEIVVAEMAEMAAMVGIRTAGKGKREMLNIYRYQEKWIFTN